MRKLLLIITILLFSVISIGVAGCSFNVILPRSSSKSSASATADSTYLRFSGGGTVSMRIGETKPLSGLIETNIPDATLIWGIDNGIGVGIVSVNSDGDVTGLAQGTAHVKATARYNNKDYSATIKVTVSGNYLELHDALNNKVESLTMYVGDSLDLTTFIYTNIPLDKVNVVLETGADAYVSLSGKTVTATTASGNNYASVKLDAPEYGSQYTFKIFVKDLPSFEFFKDGVSIDNILIYVGGTLNLNDYVSTTQPSVSYEITGGQSYASVSGTTLTGVAVGTATVKASLNLTDSFVTHEPITDTATVTVLDRPANAFALNVDDVNLLLNDTHDMWTNVTQNLHTPVTAADCTWSVNNSNTQVNASGIVTGKAVGSSVLTVSVTQYGYTFSDTATITVTGTQFVFPDSIPGHPELSGGVLTITVGDVVDLNTYLVTNITSPTITWIQTDGASYATLNTTNGQITGAAVGTSHVTASTTIGSTPLNATITVRVVAPQITLSNTNIKLYADEQINLSSYMTTNILGPTNFVYEITTPGGNAYANINGSSGLLQAVAAGSIDVRVKTSRTGAGYAEATASVAIAAVPTLAFNVTSLNVYVGDAVDLKPLIDIANFGTYTKDNIVFASSNTSVTISGSTATVVSTGSSPVISASLTTNYSTLGQRIFSTSTSNSLTFNVSAQPTFTFDASGITMTVGDSYDLNNEIVTTIPSPILVWTITTGADTIIEMPSADGNITALAEGLAIVKVSCTLTYQTLEATLNVQVTKLFDPELVIVYKNNIYDTYVAFTSLGNTIASAQQAASTQAGGDVPARTLTQNVDYTYSKSGGTCSLTLKQSYLTELAQKTGQYELRFTDTASVVQIVNVLVVDDTITTLAQLEAIGDSEESLSKSYILGADIDCLGSSGHNFEPIGEYYNDNYWSSGLAYKNKPFYGTLNGAGHKIYNLVINAANCTKSIHNQNVSMSGWQGGRNVAFVSYLGSSGVLCNITFEDVSITTSHQIAGVVAGTVAGRIENVKVDTLKVFTGSGWTNATLGGSYSTANSCSVNTGAWEGGGEFGLDCFTGAFAGIVSTGGEIRNCISMTTLKSSEPKAMRGFVGKCYGVISDCYSYALSPFNSSIMQNFSSAHVDFNPWSASNPNYDLLTIMSCYNSDDPSVTPNPSDVLIDLNHIADGNPAGKGFTYPAFKGYWQNSTKQLVGAELTTGGWVSYTNSYYTLITNSGMVSDLTALQNASLFANFDPSIWNITNGSIPTLKVSYNA